MTRRPNTRGRRKKLNSAYDRLPSSGALLYVGRCQGRRCREEVDIAESASVEVLQAGTGNTFRFSADAARHERLEDLRAADQSSPSKGLALS